MQHYLPLYDIPRTIADVGPALNAVPPVDPECLILCL